MSRHGIPEELWQRLEPGEHIDVYDITRAVEDGATVPLYYESRLARIELPEEERPKIDREIEELTEDDDASEQEALKRE